MNRSYLNLALILTLALVAAAACSDKYEGPEENGAIVAPTGIRAVRVAEAGPSLGPDASAFEKAPQLAVALIAQTVVVPRNAEAAVDEVTVRAVHDGDWLSLLLEWRDETVNNSMGIGEFEDLIAIQFPQTPGPGVRPNIMMGDARNAVTILQWRAGMQATLERGEMPNIRHAYPNTQVDIDIINLLGEEVGRPYRGAAGLGNPISVPHLDMSPVLVHVAAGFGSLTVYPGRHVEGHGVHNGTHWRVTMHIPIRDGNNVAEALRPGKESVMGFAAWDGEHHEVGSRKSWSPAWITIRLEP